MTGSVIRYSTTSAGAASAPARAKDVPAVRTRASYSGPPPASLRPRPAEETQGDPAGEPEGQREEQEEFHEGVPGEDENEVASNQGELGRVHEGPQQQERQEGGGEHRQESRRPRSERGGGQFRRPADRRKVQGKEHAPRQEGSERDEPCDRRQGRSTPEEPLADKGDGRIREEAEGEKDPPVHGDRFDPFPGQAQRPVVPVLPPEEVQDQRGGRSGDEDPENREVEEQGGDEEVAEKEDRVRRQGGGESQRAHPVSPWRRRYVQDGRSAATAACWRVRVIGPFPAKRG